MNAEGPGLPQGIMPPGILDTSEEPPARVSFALEVIHWANRIQEGRGRSDTYEKSPEGRQLTALETIVYSAALEVLRLYLSGEMDFVEEKEATKSEGCFFCKPAT